MKRKKWLALFLSMSIVTGCVPVRDCAFAAEDAGSRTEEPGADPVEDPYSDYLESVLEDKQNVYDLRKQADEKYADNLNSAESSIKKMESVKSHLKEQALKYPDYEKVHAAEKTAEKKTDEAKLLLVSSQNSASTGEYKYGIEVAPDISQQQESDNAFAKIGILGDEVADSDFTVDYFRGFYDVGSTRKKIVNTALKEKGRISYQWGAKSVSDKEPAGLDCSGFVQWVYHKATKDDYSKISSTASVGTNYSQIKKDELRPGDVGMKNPEGTCYVAADGEKFYSRKSAVDCNKSQNKKIRKKIKAKKQDFKDYKNDLKGAVDSYISDLTTGKNISWDTGNSLSRDAEKDSSDPLEREEALLRAALTDKNFSLKKRASEVKTHYQNALQIAESRTDNEIKSLKKAEVDPEKAVSQQIGHIGIYAGKNSDGEDIWVHCTGGNKDTVVVTTEKEYDGFKYYYSPLEGEKTMTVDDIRIPSAEPEADYEVDVPEDLAGYDGFKTYERYTAIHAKDTPQYKLQTIASTDTAGFRKVQGRYLIAVGTGVTSDVGRYVDVVLENGTVIPCIIGDIKADIHTESRFHIMTRHSRCVSEFIVDGDLLPDVIKTTGNVSSLAEDWNSKVKKFIVYKDNAIKQR